MTVNGSVTVAPVPTLPQPHPPSPGRCTRGQFLCHRPPHCIPDWQRCDGQLNCQDGSDEAYCRKSEDCSGSHLFFFVHLDFH